MKIWEAILYAIFGGISELLPISFAGHAAILENALALQPLNAGGGYYIHAAICLGVMLAIRLAFSAELRTFKRELALMGGMRRRRRGERSDPFLRRSIALGFVALIPMLLSLIFTARAERMNGLLTVAAFFALNGLFLFSCCRGKTGEKTEKNALLGDVLLLGLVRACSIFPGLSSLGGSMGVGRVRGFSLNYNLRVAYLLTFVYQAALFLYRLVRAFAFGSFTFSLLLPIIFTVLFSAVAGYLAVQYFRYLLQRRKLGVFAYYCWGAAVLSLILLLINA